MASTSDYEEITEDERQQLLRNAPRTSYKSTIQPRQYHVQNRNSHFSLPEEATESPGTGLTDSMSILETPTTYALNVCRKKVLAPYRKLLLLVGWEPVFEDANTKCKKAINVIHPIIVMLLVVLGYIIQYSSCFRRDNIPPSNEHDSPSSKLCTVSPRNNSTDVKPATDGPAFNTCYGRAISQYLIPDLFHSAAYLYSFYIMRFAQRENLASLVMRTFLQASPTQAGFWSQGKLLRTMRAALYFCLAWWLLSLVSQIIHVVVLYHDHEIVFKWFHPQTQFANVTLVLFMLVSFMALNVVYVLVVLNYCCQCTLLIFYIEGLQEKIKRGEFQLVRGMQEMQEIQEHLDVLNYKTGLALSIVVFNFATMTILEFFAITKPCLGAALYGSMGLSLFCWLAITAIPFIQAARLSAAGNKLRKMGHEIRVKAFAYQNADPKELDSFLLFTSSLRLGAKIFMIPIKTSYVSAVIVITLFIVLVLFQTGDLEIWLKS